MMGGSVAPTPNPNLFVTPDLIRGPASSGYLALLVEE
ncbi:hypothetical protein FHT60_002831 [Novosphingobium sp. BK486]|nr:hypothetical protein [Novosphingobium sp. BK256]MBB3375512.1 hypothetical protein [Novosphingobium sp. BK280]MBB3379779.1 hypothetical protein [Novosphingobium sp. BK258]MBB3421474.1 hypothetical protein [Novosphingobium sp. BK267]MBB3449789.1 hypothetical protein [Novosphingobium sp. BK352]MBB3478786.1 hypothetical protein [Novosphingobium sp. BK369]MBB3502100.1 hypothetical protein [Novosphingobium sp. BK336]MBB3537739.1 hypothetical protein [Novosphingobium sp. BK486]MBB3557137.1 hypo